MHVKAETERLAFALGDPSRKNAEGEKLPGVSPWRVRGVPPLRAEPKKEEDKRRESWPGDEEVLPLAFLMVDVTFFVSPNTDLNAHELEGVRESRARVALCDMIESSSMGDEAIPHTYTRSHSHHYFAHNHIKHSHR